MFFCAAPHHLVLSILVVCNFVLQTNRMFQILFHVAHALCCIQYEPQLIPNNLFFFFPQRPAPTALIRLMTPLSPSSPVLVSYPTSPKISMMFSAAKGLMSFLPKAPMQVLLVLVEGMLTMWVMARRVLVVMCMETIITTKTTMRTVMHTITHMATRKGRNPTQRGTAITNKMSPTRLRIPPPTLPLPCPRSAVRRTSPPRQKQRCFPKPLRARIAIILTPRSILSTVSTIRTDGSAHQNRANTIQPVLAISTTTALGRLAGSVRFLIPRRNTTAL